MKKMTGTARLGALAAVALAVSVATATSADMAKLLEYRQNLMKAQGGAAGDIVMMVKGDMPFNAQQVAAFATVINTTSKLIPDLFPKGSGAEAGKTNAKDEIWRKWDDFTKIAMTLQTESAKLIEVAKGGDEAAIKAQVGVMGKQGCGACHESFRKPLQ
jgi:cytochrome c556